MSLVQDIAQDIAASENLRLLALLPLTPSSGDARYRIDENGHSEVVYAYAAERGGEARYFVTRSTVDAPVGWPRTEVTTARSAVEAALYVNGFGGRAPRAVAID